MCITPSLHCLHGGSFLSWFTSRSLRVFDSFVVLSDRLLCAILFGFTMCCLGRGAMGVVHEHEMPFVARFRDAVCMPEPYFCWTCQSCGRRCDPLLVEGGARLRWLHTFFIRKAPFLCFSEES